MVFLRRGCVVAVLAHSRTKCTLLRCVQARLALTQKSSSGGGAHE